MRIHAIVLTFGLILATAATAFGAVELQGNLVIQDTGYGARYLGEVINDTGTAITYVRVTVTAKDTTGAVIDMPYAYIDGYRDPDTDLNTFLPAGFYAPFMFYGTANAADIDSYTVNIDYVPTEQTHPDTTEVSMAGPMTVVSDFVGTTFLGEIENNSSEYINFVDITVAVKDSVGDLVELNAVSVFGDDFHEPGSVYTDTLIQPGERAPFRVLTLIDSSLVDTYYPIITYRPGAEGRYHYFGDDEVVTVGEPEQYSYFGYIGYRGTIENNTDRDIYFVQITFTSFDDMGHVLDVDYTYVDGTEYEIAPGASTPTHIAPGESAPFDIVSLSTTAALDSFSYVITYRYEGAPVFVEEETPETFTLGQNFPNPFNPATTIPFTLPGDMPVTLRIYNMAGQLVDEPVNAPLAAGAHDIRWDATRFPSGVYIYSLTAGGATIRRKMTLIR